MEKMEIVKGLTYLGIAVGKEFTQEECEVYYDFLKGYSYQTFIEAIKNRIKKSPYLPKVNELIEECELVESQTKLATIEFMKAKGYFKATIEYEKALNFVKRGIIPGWLQNDMQDYFKQMNLPKLKISS